MSSNITFSLEGVSKTYRLYPTPKHYLLQYLSDIIRNFFNKQSISLYKERKVLKDISFTVKQGEVIGVVGKNGAGKSTLLQVMCGVLAADSGIVRYKGRLAALLELGAGFNPEFTGRENVYLNAAIFGISKTEIDLRFNDIVEFSELEHCIDQPVKTYSTGMYVRLAFSVIAHLSPDILIIDEALAVGDALFTQKCIRFIKNFSSKGTLFYVSHDIASVKRICSRALWLDAGEIVMDGPPAQVCDAYLEHLYKSDVGISNINDTVSNNLKHSETEQIESIANYESDVEITDNLQHAVGWNTGVAEIVSVNITDKNGSSISSLSGGESIIFNISAKLHDDLNDPILGFIVKDRLGQELFGENTLPVTGSNKRVVSKGAMIQASFNFTFPMLQSGTYVAMVSLAAGDLYTHVQHHYLNDALVINVTSSNIRYGIVGAFFHSIKFIENETAYVKNV